MSFTLRLIPAAAAACLLASCGGGGGSAPGDLGGSGPPPVATSGVAVDGYLAGANVLCDGNGNGRADTGELGVGTDAGGRFSFPLGCASGLVLNGGTNVDTGLPFIGVLRAPAGASVVSPLTTLLVAGLSAAQITTALGLPADTDLLNTDPALTVDGVLVNADLMKKAAAVQQLLQKTAEVFAALAGSNSLASLQALYTEVVAAFAAQLPLGAPLISGSTVDLAVVMALVKAATERVAASTTLSPMLSDGAGSVNPDTLAQVIASALQVQAQSLLTASDAGLTAATLAAQGSTTINSFVLANRAQLVGAPSVGTAALADALTVAVGGVVVGPPPPPPPPPVTDYLALASDAILLVDGPTASSYTMAQFQSAAGIRVAWPVPSPTTLRVAVTEVGTAAIPAGQKLSAAVAISETTPTGQGTLLGYVEGVDVVKTAAGLQITVPSVGESIAYAVSSDGNKKAVIDFGDAVANVTNTLRLATAGVNNIVFGEVIQFAVNRVSNDFTGINALRGKYKVSIVIHGLPLRKADGTALPVLNIAVPTVLDSSGAGSAPKSITGPGLEGFITLTD